MTEQITTPEALDLARNIVNQILDGAVEQGGYSLVDMGARQRFNDIADRFVAELLAARQSAPVDAETVKRGVLAARWPSGDLIAGVTPRTAGLIAESVVREVSRG